MMTISRETNKPQRYWMTALGSFFLVLFTMPLGHATMMLMDLFLEESILRWAAFGMGAVGMFMVVVGVFAKTDLRETLWGFFGGLLVWTGWIEFLFQYYAERYHIPADLSLSTGAVTRPEYLIMPATFGIWAMVMMMYIFSTKNGCNFINWMQRFLLGAKKKEIAARPMTRHASIVTFMELMMILWTSYLLLMFCYDPVFIGDDSFVTFAVALGAFVSSFVVFSKQLRLKAWGANIRMAIPAVILFWTPIEVMARNNFFTEIWLEPLKYLPEMTTILVAFTALFVYLFRKK